MCIFKVLTLECGKEYTLKKWLCAAGLGLVMSASAVQAADNVAVVNVGDIFQQLPERDKVAKQLESEFKGRATELQSMEKDLQTKMERLQRDGKNMKASDRTKLEKEVMDKRAQFASKAQSFEQDNRRRQAEERGKIFKKIQSAVKTVANKKGYNVVVDSNAAIYADSANDITAEVLKQVK